MKKYLFLVTCILFSACLVAQGLQTPDAFLGYKLGSRYTRHDRLVAYCRSVAQAMPAMVKIEKYGETNEGRELLVAFVASAANLQRLEDIRKNNLRLTGVLQDGTKAEETGAPAIVWLSYNVHGNEPSSSEAAMKTLYTLVDPSNAQSKEWLKNTVVAIDPCLNPDGRDRYVNWFNGMTGAVFNTDPQAREHREPWPGGRSNHYNFDLNRDWAWQTQIESQQRLKKYNEWLPQVHVDYHEQGVNEPYYFAPAAEPFHEVITPWQREFQTTIGKGNAGYFDGKGWLYFTKELFDLFYPSYGDTYPLYNGAIGMTYEQGGGPRGGLGILNEAGDTVTLEDRMMHHYVTGLATIETTSKHAQQVIREFRKFFDDSRAARSNEYKTYVLTSPDEARIAAVKKLLDRNKILYTAASGPVEGYRYFTGHDEKAQLDNYSIAISMYQPKSVLARVLLEPQSKLNDSVTYDITAWSIPYAYGVEGYALKEKKEFGAAPAIAAPVIGASTYGYLVPYHALNGAQLLAALLKNGIKVRVSEKPFTCNNKNYDAGTLIILQTSNGAGWSETLAAAAAKFHLSPEPIQTGMVEKGADFGSSAVHVVHAPKVAVCTGEGVSSTDAGEIWNLFDQSLEYPVSMVNASDLGRLSLKDYTVLVLPDGFYRALSDKAAMDRLREFVRGGGKIIAIQGAASQLASNDWGFHLKEDKGEDTGRYASIKKYADRQREAVPGSVPGAIYRVNLDNTHPLAFGYPDYYYTLKQDPGIYEFLKDGWNVGTLRRDNYIAGFTGNRVKGRIKDGVVFGVHEIGSGEVIFFADNPLFRMFWENGKLLFCNAVFMVD